MVDLLGGPDTTRQILLQRLGYAWDWDDLGDESRTDVVDNSPVPFGTEGSIQYEIVKTRSDDGILSHSLYWGHIAIYGDLRDFDNPQEIYDWLVNSLATINDDGLGFRDVIVSIEVERIEQYIIFLDPGEQKLRMAKGEAKIC
jgi:hypothetical protein